MLLLAIYARHDSELDELFLYGTTRNIIRERIRMNVYNNEEDTSEKIEEWLDWASQKYAYLYKVIPKDN